MTVVNNRFNIEEDIIHYCVPNMTGVLGRTATHAMNNASWPFVRQIAELGLEKAISTNSALERGLYTHEGDIVQPKLRAALEGRR